MTATSDGPDGGAGGAPAGGQDAPGMGVGTRLRGVAGLRGSPLARKIVVVNLLALTVLVAGVVWLAPFRDGLVQQRGAALLDQAALIAGLAAPQVLAGQGAAPGSGAGGSAVGGAGARAPGPTGAPAQGSQATGADPLAAVAAALQPGVALSIHDASGARVTGGDGADPPAAPVAAALAGAPGIDRRRNADGHTVLTVAVPVRMGGAVIGAVALTGAAGEVDRIAQAERMRMAQVFVLALLVSIGLSLVLASTIATPIAELAAAAERGRDRNARTLGPGRVRIPDLAARTDEIGRLSSAMRGMVAALYDRIEMNEQFAADVAHEIKNPLASLRSAVGTLRVARRDDQRDRLLDVIEHDVRRLDRLVSDISNASRLDSELVKEQEARFDLVAMLRTLSAHFATEARERGIEVVTDLPADPVEINGLEARLAQVFVNLLSNAVSFCEDGDAVRLWARRRDNRVLIVVEDTGPGIPEAAVTKIFKRFYSERPAQQFGNHSGLGLAISRQIVEAHGGVIWAENIHPTEADPGSDPLGARFVVGLPV